MLGKPVTPAPLADRPDQFGPILALFAALIWPLQAAVIAVVLADLLTGSATVPPLAAVTAYLGLAIVRAAVANAAERRLSSQAALELKRLRRRIVQTEAHAAEGSVAGAAGALAALAVEKLETLRPYMMRYRPARLRTMVVPLVILALALSQSWAIALVLLLAGPLIPLFMALVGWAAKEASSRQLGEIGQLSDLLVDRQAALSDLRLVGAGPAVVESFGQASETLRSRTMAVLRIAFLSSTVLELFAALGVAMVAVWVGFALLGEITWGSWGKPLTPFSGIFLLLLAPEFFQPLRDLAAAWHDKAAAEAVRDEIAAWEADARPAMMGCDCPARGQAISGTITLRGLTARRGAQVLRYPDTDIEPGARIAIKGPSGAGKSTLLRLLAGLERPAEGKIRVGGSELNDQVVRDWRARLGWMPQAPHFLGRSLRYNIGFDAALDPVILEQAQLSEVVHALPRNVNTVLGERGAGLSGGEARRAMLARALHGRPAVLLADEPTADLDARTADAVVSGLLEFAAKGGTLIVATHDAGLISRMEKVIELTKSEAAT